jgi:hypothetical protein
MFRSRLPSPRTLAAALAASLLAATLPAETVAKEADILHYVQTFYSTHQHLVEVGKGYSYCDGDYIMVSGYQTGYWTIRNQRPCP